MSQAVEADGAASPGFLAGGGEMGALMRAHDWASTPLGPPNQWPQSLKTAVRIMLTSRQPIWIGWGKELLFFYNDPYHAIIGGKHPWALGRPTSVVWQEIWDDVSSMLATAMTGVEGTFVEEQLLVMERNGYPEETYYTFSYSPIPDDDGSAGGIICANSDDTRRVIGERQLALLRELAATTAEARSWQEACERSAQALGTNAYDLPFAMLYMAEPESGSVSLVGASGIEPGHPAAPLAMAFDRPSIWPFGEVLRRQDVRLVPDLRKRLGVDLPTGVWAEPPSRAAMLPILPSSETGRAGVLIVGLNPYRLFDEGYRGFLELAAGQIGAAIGNAQAYEEERRRAEALAEIDRAKTTFFSNISHELRTPLTLMLGPLEELLAKAQDDSEAGDRALIELTHRNGLRLLKLVNALLDFSRIEAGRTQVSYEPTDLSAFTAELASTFRSAMSKAGLDFVVDCAPLPELAQIDRDMWEKVVLNLISNAFKFTFEGTIRVEVRATQGGSAAELRVSDTGIGIDADELPRLFERFHRVEGARGRTIEGSGIGLALVQELVKLHEGSIRVESEPGHGTCFTVTLPLGMPRSTEESAQEGRQTTSVGMRAQAYAEEALRWLPDAEGTGGPQAGLLPSASDDAHPQGGAAGGARVLIADDNADLRDYMRRLLLAEGYEVELASDGQEALEAVRSHPPDLVLSDIMMPRLDGLGLLEALRADSALDEIPVLLLSARAGEEARVEGLDAGADDYLTKPFSARELVARVGSNLKLARLRRETQQRLREEARTLEILNEVGSAIAAELDLARAMQVVTDAATELAGAALGALVLKAESGAPQGHLLHTLSGASRESPADIPILRATELLASTLQEKRLIRSDDITADGRDGGNDVPGGTPDGPSPVRSYLAVPMTSRMGDVVGGLLLVHPEACAFDERAERLVVGIAAQAAIAIDNARLYEAAQSEIAERAKAEAALRELNETLEQRVAETVAERDRLWELSEDLLVITDHEKRILRVSPSWTRTLGHDRAALLLRSALELVHPDDRAKARASLREARIGGRPARYECRFATADGSWRWIDWTLSPDPGKTRLLGVGRDVTADKEAALALEQAEEALRLAQKMEAVGNLTGGVAHDFNNLLQVIGGNLQLLAKDVAGSERAEQRVRSALAGVSRGSKLASQLLAFGRRQPLAPKVVNLGRFIRGLDDMLRRALGDGIEIETVITGGLWNALVDPFQVENALLNLAINARDAMDGHGRLTIEAGNAWLDDAYAARHPGVGPGQYVMIAITDTGCGMTPEVMEHVFEPFFTTKLEGQGTGLGLSMVYGFVKQSDGHVKIYSEPGQGTTVRIYLPRVRQQEDVATEMESGPVTGGTETVLVVEDDEGVRTTVVEMLADLGYRVLRAKDAQGALTIVESGVPVDLLFTDVVMPGALRSPELARKARERLPGIAVLFTSGYTDNAIVHSGRLDEGVELLSKPYTREALARKVRQVLGSQRQAAAAPPVQQPAKGQTPAPSNDAGGALRVLLVEDDALIRLGTADMLADLGHTVLEAGDAPEALAILDAQPVDVMITDISLPGLTGIELAEQARQRFPALRIVFASGMDAPQAGEGEAGDGSVTQLRKPYSEKQLIEALRAATG